MGLRIVIGGAAAARRAAPPPPPNSAFTFQNSKVVSLTTYPSARFLSRRTTSPPRSGQSRACAEHAIILRIHTDRRGEPSPARVQRGPSEAARCASKGGSRAGHPLYPLAAPKGRFSQAKPIQGHIPPNQSPTYLRVVIEAVRLRAWAEHIPMVRGLRATGWPHDHPLSSPLYS